MKFCFVHFTNRILNTPDTGRDMTGPEGCEVEDWLGYAGLWTQ